MGHHAENADFPLLADDTHELALSRGDHGADGYHICTDDGERIDKGMMGEILDAARAADAQGVEDVITASPAAPWWARLQSHLVAIGRIQTAAECRDVWLAAMQRRVDW